MNAPARIRFQEGCAVRLLQTDLAECEWNSRLEPGQSYECVVLSDLHSCGDNILGLVSSRRNVDVLRGLAGELDIVSCDEMLQIVVVRATIYDAGDGGDG